MRTVCDGHLCDCDYISEVILGTKEKGLGPSGEEKLWSHLLGTTSSVPSSWPFSVDVILIGLHGEH